MGPVRPAQAAPVAVPARALLFCDDFEARTGLTGPWTAQLNGSGTVAVDTTTGHSGTRSVHVHAGDSDFDTFFVLHDATVLPAPNGRFYLRTYVRLGRAMSAGHNAYLIGESVSSAGGNTLRLGEMNEMLMYTISGDTHGALSNQNYYSDHKPGVSFPASAWVCLELLIDHAKPEIDVWVGGSKCRTCTTPIGPSIITTPFASVSKNMPARGSTSGTTTSP